MEQLSLFHNEHVQINVGDKVTIKWNECDLEYIKKSLPQLLTIGVVTREKLGSYDVQFGDHTSYLFDYAMILKKF